jgi:hypothetical protein
MELWIDPRTITVTGARDAAAALVELAVPDDALPPHAARPAETVIATRAMPSFGRSFGIKVTRSTVPPQGTVPDPAADY